MKTGRMSRLILPPAVITQDSEPLHQHRRLAILRRVLNDDSLPLRAQVAAALVLLYAQPVSRIVRLTIDDVTDDETTVTVQLGDPQSPLPEPVADLMRAYIQSRQHLPYASSRRIRSASKSTCERSASRRSAAGPPPFANSPPGPRLPSSRRHSATTTRQPPAWSPKPEEHGADTPPATTSDEARYSRWVR